MDRWSRMSLVARSVRETRTDRPDARNGISAEIESPVGRGRLRRSQSAGVRSEQVDLGIVPAVVGPDPKVSPRHGEIDAIAEPAANHGVVQRVARR